MTAFELVASSALVYSFKFAFFVGITVLGVLGFMLKDED